MNRKQTLQSMVRYLLVRHDIKLELSDPNLEAKLIKAAKKLKDNFFDEYWRDHLNVLATPLTKKGVKKIAIDNVIERSTTQGN